MSASAAAEVFQYKTESQELLTQKEIVCTYNGFKGVKLYVQYTCMYIYTYSVHVMLKVFQYRYTLLYTCTHVEYSTCNNVCIVSERSTYTFS